MNRLNGAITKKTKLEVMRDGLLSDAARIESLTYADGVLDMFNEVRKALDPLRKDKKE